LQREYYSPLYNAWFKDRGVHMNGGTRSRLIAPVSMYGMAMFGVAMFGVAIYAIAAIATTSEAAAGQATDSPREGRRVEIVRFADKPVTVVHGADPGGTLSARREIVSFANSTARPVTIIRGTGEPTASAPPATPTPSSTRPSSARTTVERIAFAGSVPASVTIVRGTAAMGDPSSGAAFLPATALDFERIAEAVHGAESSYGADPAMWRPDPDGPQGPMQISAAAAYDTGGGNRFDPEENRLLGRAYLARMLRRYGNWPDALAAYNWGPGNVDRWVAGGRDPARLPLETTRYIGRVLRNARIVGSRIVGAESDARLPITR
jgi:Transglycosylase SLT domain